MLVIDAMIRCGPGWRWPAEERLAAVEAVEALGLGVMHNSSLTVVLCRAAALVERGQREDAWASLERYAEELVRIGAHAVDDSGTPNHLKIARVRTEAATLRAGGAPTWA